MAAFPLLLHSLDLNFFFFLFQGLSLLHDVLRQAVVDPHDQNFVPTCLTGGAWLGHSHPPHAPGTLTLILPAVRRPDVLVFMCCLWIEDKYLPGEHHHELSRRMFSTLALGNLVLSHNFPPH